MDERALPAKQGQVIHEYGEPLDAEVKEYSLRDRCRKAASASATGGNVREERLEPLTRPRLLRPLANARDLWRPDGPSELRLAAA